MDITIWAVMKMGFADLHIHSQYSDGTMTPEEIVRSARSVGAVLISVCDHNVIEGTARVAPLAAAAGLQYLHGAEIDTIWDGADVHILCYGADITHPALRSALHHARKRLDDMSVELLRRMAADYPAVSLSEYEQTAHDPRRGGWKLLQYLVRKRVTAKLKDGFAFYARYGVTYADAGFQDIETVARAIHASGGRAVLAHPQVTFAGEGISGLEARVCGAMEMGLDGVECHHPSQDAGVSRYLRALCDAHGWMITAGSDCHGDFNGRRIACNQIDVGKLRLGRDFDCQLIRG